MKKNALLVAVLWGLALASVPLLWAQATTGTISGKVTSPSGLAVPNAAVTITEVNTGASRRVLTASDGSFSVSGLAPGTYRVEVENPGFKRSVRENLQLTTETPAAIDITLEPGAPSETTTARVEAEAPAVQADSGQVNHFFSTRMITDVPILDRNRQQLVEFVPGIAPPEALNSRVIDPQRSRIYAVNGQGEIGAIYRDYQIDGSENVEPYLGIATHVPPNESIQAFNVITSNPRVQYGRSGGDQEPVMTRSGSNDFHGTLFEFNSFNWLRARDVFNNPPNPSPTYTFNQFGANVGGRIIRDRVFFMGSYEGELWRGENTEIATVPTADFRAGDFSAVPGLTVFDPSTGTAGVGRTPFTGNMIPADRISPTAAAILPFIPLPKRPGIENNFLRNVPFRNDGNRFDGRVDLHASDHTSAFARYGYSRFYGRDESPLGSTIGNTLEGKIHAHSGALGVTHSFTPAVTTEGRFAVQRYDNRVYAPVNSSLAATLGITNLPGPGLPAIEVAGMPVMGTRLGFLGSSTTGLPLVGPTAGSPFGVDNTFQWTNTWNMMVNRHNVRWGVDVWRIRSDGFRNTLFAPNGEFLFGPGPTSAIDAPLVAGGLFPSAFAAFLLGEPTQRAVESFAFTPNLRTTFYTGFVSDSVKLHPRLTLDLGLRYDVFAPLAVHRGGTAAIYNPGDNSLRLVGVGGLNNRAGVAWDTDNFAPRFGFAAKITNRTVVRGGYGLTYFSPTLAFASGYLNPITVGAQQGIVGGLTSAGGSRDLPMVAAFPANANGLISPAPNQTLVFGPTNPSTPYVQSYSFMVQQDFGSGTLFEIAYVGTLGRELPFSREINAAASGAGLTGLPLEPAFGRTASTIERGYGLNSNYNALQTSLKKRFGHDISFAASYTYGKALDHGSNPFVPLVRPTKLDYGPADFDRKHIFTLSHLIQIPVGVGSGRLKSGAVGQALGGWQLNGVFRWATGTPFSVIADPTACGCPGVPYLYADQVAGIGPDAENGFNPAAFAPPRSGAFGNSGRNILRGPGFKTYDLSLFRSFSFRERGRFEIRGEAYNLTNSPIFTNPVNIVNAANFGQLIRTLPANLTSGNNRELHLGARIVF